ncbi:hypothetical protein EWM64_g8498 [Hericium alpestre]|uniref:Uncharacterized protein n=1 Tax=Hericium alpestre TaxID=135208 RepID=A0A4Y9ZLL8_9AGAM|nr:hypothetical protein EWM64_g8498 [Hericium alpestre]
MPAGTAKSLLGKAQKFETTSAAKKSADFVTKDNEPGDLGINGVAKSADGTLPLDQVRNKVIRTVVKTSAKGSQQFVTIKNGKASKTAAKADQALLNKIGC